MHQSVLYLSVTLGAVYVLASWNERTCCWISSTLCGCTSKCVSSRMWLMNFSLAGACSFRLIMNCVSGTSLKQEKANSRGQELSVVSA